MADYSTKYTVLIKSEIYDSLDSLDTPIGYVYPTDEVHLNLIEPNVGNYYQFSKVTIDEDLAINSTDQPGLKEEYRGVELFIRSCFLAPADSSGITQQSKLSFEVVGEYEEEYTPNPIKIKDAELDLPYSEGGCVNIVVDTGYTNPADIEDTANMKALKEEAIQKMVEYYGRNTQSSTQIEEFAINPFNLVEVSEPYFPVRPGKGIHLKFCVRNHYFDAFPSRTFEEYTVDNIHKNYIAVNVKASELESMVSQVVKVLEKYDSDISKFSGSVTGINLKKLSNELRSFLSQFKKLLSANKISLETVGESKFEIGFHAPNEDAADDCDKKGSYKLEYILLFNPYGTFLSVGLSNLTKSVSTGLAKLIIAHKEVISASLGGMGWQQLLENYFGGEFKINFSTPAAKNSSAVKPKSQLQNEVKNATADHADLSIMDHDKNKDLSNIKKDPKFKQSASELLIKSRDTVGDNFLINLPEILANVDDLTSLYGLVFDKVSIKDLTDLLMDKMTENLNLPDVNEIKLRGILKSLNIDISLDLVEQFIQSPYEMREFMLAVCDVYEFKKEEIDKILGMFTTLPFPIEFYFFHYKHTTGTAPNLGGFLPDSYNGADTFEFIRKLEENGIISDAVEGCSGVPKHIEAYANNNFKISDYFQSSVINDIMCKIFTDGLGTSTQGYQISEQVCAEYGINFGLPGTAGATAPFDLPTFDFYLDLKGDIFQILKTLDKNIIAKAVDVYIKGLFKTSKDFNLDNKLKSNMPSGQYALSASSGIASPPPPEFQFNPGELFDRFTSIPKINIELDKLNLTKKKMLNKIPNIDIDLEMKKKDVNFTLPSIKSVNPSFDFTSFEFTAMGDIFGTAVGAIEDAIVDGIEKGLVNAFKGILNNVLDSLNMDMPDIGAPDFGGLDMNDLLDASNGISADGIANILLDDFKFDIGKNPLFDPCADPDLSDFIPSAEDIKNAFSQMSAALKPMELTRIMKGQKNKKDYNNILPAITDERMKLALTPMAFDRMMEVVADFADTAMLEELEAAYDNKEVMVSICKDNGIPYCLGEIKETLKEKYSTLSEPEICDLIDGIVEETKDSLVDAIGNMKEDFKDSLPFTEDPCSFMPKPNDIPAMNFVNDLAFDTVFTPIKMEYKQEASSFPDMMMQTKEKDEYIKLRFERYDSIVRDTVVDPDYGIFKIQYEFVFQAEPSIDFGDLTGDGGLYNQEFGNHYYGSQTPIYYKDSAGNYREARKSKYEIEQQGDESYQFTGDYQNLYVKKLEESMQPLPSLKASLIDNRYQILGYSSNAASGLAIPSIAETETRTPKLEAGIRIIIPGLKTAEPRFQFPEVSLDAEDSNFGLVTEDHAVLNFWDPQSPVIYHDKYNTIGVSMAFPTIEALTNPECVTFESEPLLITDDFSHGYVAGISGSINYMMKKKMDEKYLSSGNSYNGLFQFHMDGYDNFSQHMDAFNLDQKDLVCGLTAQTTQLFMNSFSDSELFDTNAMLSFLFDTEDINLFDVESVKNAAKDEYNEKCDFTDSDKSQMKSTTIKKLIYLTVRIYVIDVVMLSCFVNSVAYDETINNYLKEFIFEYMKAQLLKEKDSYYSVFKDFYSETYGQELEQVRSDGSITYSESFDKLITEVYAEVAEHFEKIFPLASNDTTNAFVEQSNIFIGDKKEFVTFLYDTYMGALAEPKSNNRFIIKLIYNSDFNNKETFYDGSQSLAHGVLTARLCYVADWRELNNGSAEEGFVSLDSLSLESMANQLGWADTSAEEETIISNLNKYPINYLRLDLSEDSTQTLTEQIENIESTSASVRFLGTIRVKKLPKTASFNYIYELGTSFSYYPHLVCIPLAESGITGLPFAGGLEDASRSTADWETMFPDFRDFVRGLRTSRSSGNMDSYLRKNENLLVSGLKQVASKRTNTYGIKDFVVNRLRSESYFDLLRRCMISKMQQIKPETALIFQDTKSAIRRAILTVSQEKDTFDYIDQDAAEIHDIQAAGVGTDPDFSPKAKKMALMTVPLIIKGMAEMFDPNTKLASLIRKGANLSGVNISPPVASLMALPFNIIPLAPGPPITPLGLTYLATSFLEPKERKQLSDIKRGKNRNPKTDPITGGLEIGTPQEQLAERNEAAAEAVGTALRIHMAISQLCRDFASAMDSYAFQVYATQWDDWDDDVSRTLETLDYPSDPEGSIKDWFGDAYDVDTMRPLPTPYTPFSPNAYNLSAAHYIEHELNFEDQLFCPLDADYDFLIEEADERATNSFTGRIRAVAESFTTPMPDYGTDYDPILEGENLQRFFKALNRLASPEVFSSTRSSSTYRFNRSLIGYAGELNPENQDDANLSWYKFLHNEKYYPLKKVLVSMDRMYFVTIRSIAMFSYLLADLLILEDQFFPFNDNAGNPITNGDLSKFDHEFPENIFTGVYSNPETTPPTTMNIADTAPGYSQLAISFTGGGGGTAHQGFAFNQYNHYYSYYRQWIPSRDNYLSRTEESRQTLMRGCQSRLRVRKNSLEREAISASGTTGLDNAFLLIEKMLSEFGDHTVVEPGSGGAQLYPPSKFFDEMVQRILDDYLE